MPQKRKSPAGQSGAQETFRNRKLASHHCSGNHSFEDCPDCKHAARHAHASVVAALETSLQALVRKYGNSSTVRTAACIAACEFLAATLSLEKDPLEQAQFFGDLICSDLQDFALHRARRFQ